MLLGYATLYSQCVRWQGQVTPEIYVAHRCYSWMDVNGAHGQHSLASCVDKSAQDAGRAKMGCWRFCCGSLPYWRRGRVRAIVGKVSCTMFLDDGHQTLCYCCYGRSRGLNFLSWYVILSKVRLERAGLISRGN